MPPPPNKQWEYKVAAPDPGNNTIFPQMTAEQLTQWVDSYADAGWEYVGMGRTAFFGNANSTQDWWVFRRLIK